MRHVALRLLIGFIITAGAFAAPVAEQLVPPVAPRGARLLLVGQELNGPQVSVSFPAAGGQRVDATIIARTDRFVEIVVPTNAASGKVKVLSGGSPIREFDFEVVPDPRFVTVTTIAGAPASGNALFKEPSGAVVVIPDGRIVVADTLGHQIRMIATSGQVALFAGSGAIGFKDGVGAAAELKAPRALVHDRQRGILYVADTGNHAIRAIRPDGTVTTLAGSGKIGDRDGTGAQAEFNSPAGIAIDDAGVVYVADTGNHKIRRVTAGGDVTTVAGNGQQKHSDGPAAVASFSAPEGLCVGHGGTIFVADTKNHVMRKIDGGNVSTVAGTGKPGFADGPASTATFDHPRGIAEDEAGDLLVADSNNARLRKLVRNTVSTIAGNGKSGYADGTATAAEFKDPFGVSYAGAIFLGDTKNDAVRAVWPEVKISDVYPSSGSLQRGVIEVRIFGSGFVPGRTTVTFGNQPPATVTFLSSTQLVAALPMFHSSGKVDITVSTAAGTSVLDDAYSTDTDAPSIHTATTPTATSDGWHRTPVTVRFVCFDATSGIATCPQAVTLSAEGAGQQVTGTATDVAGNSASATTTVNIDLTAPTISIAAMPAVTGQSSVVVSGTTTDALSGVKSLTCSGAAATLQGSSFTCTVPLLEGANVIHIHATDRAGNVHEATAVITADATQPSMAFLSPEDGARVNTASIVVDVQAVDEDRVVGVTINEVPAVVTGNMYRATVSLTDGSNMLIARAVDRAGNAASITRSVQYFSLPTVQIHAPADLAVVNSSTVTVSGAVTGSGVTVTVNGTPAVVTGGTFTATNVPLVQGRTVITATAVNAAGHIGTANIHVYRDSLPPRVAVYAPAEGEVVSQSPITVSGMIDDVAVGTINSGQATVTVNGIAATVANRAFTATNVPLNPGQNTLQIVAVDQGGNRVTLNHQVMFVTAPAARILTVSGNDQSGAIGTELRAPLVVRVVDGAGVPIANTLVTFEIVQNDGTISDGATRSRTVVVAANAGGEASVRWTLGRRAGAGNQRVEATAPGAMGKAAFSASGRAGVPARIVVDSGSGQFGVIDQPLQRPLVAVVVDAGSNRLANVPVTFTVLRGGTIGGQSSVTIPTDSDGRAWVVPTLGPDANPDHNVVAATVVGIAGSAVFYATGRPAGDVADTRISGVVVDNSNIPVAGVAIRVEGTTLAAQTDTEGQFVIPSAPVGYVKLVVDGSTAQRPGTWPTLEFAMYTNAGQDNTLGMPIYLLPIDVARGIQVSEQQGGTLTLPELPGFSLTIDPGSATFPNGTRAGTVSVTLVHSDKMPMPPSFGQQPRFIVTIQPTGVIFDPPAAITFPNVDGLRPGQVTEMYSFDHDLGQFVSIGTGSISEDGTTLRSDPGVGIIKGGWHCGGDPNPTGTTANCGECAICQGVVCVPNPQRAGRQCSSDGDPCTDDICSGIECAHPPLSASVGIDAIYIDRDDRQRTWTSRLTLGQPLYGNPTIGDQVRWTLRVDTSKPIAGYSWKATGPATIAGPGTASWQVDNINWKPGLYDVVGEVTFQGGCKVTRTWKQWVGIRTNEYFAAGSIQPIAVSATGVHSRTQFLFDCPMPIGTLTWATIASLEGGFNAEISSTTIGIPKTYVDRHYANARLFTHIADQVPVPRFHLLFPDSDDDYGLSPDIDYRYFIRAQFKYLVRDGKLVMSPLPVGRNRVITGETTSPCGTYLFLNLDAHAHPDSGKVFGGAGDEDFYYMVKVRAGDRDQIGFSNLNGRVLPWVFLKLRFNTQDGELHTRWDAPSSWHGLPEYGGVDDGGDYTYFPTIFVFRRDGPTEATLIRRQDQQMNPYIESAPILPNAPYVYPLDEVQP